MFTYRLLNLDGTPAEHTTFTSSQPDWRVGDKVLIRPGTEYRIVEIEAAPDVHGVWIVEPVPNGQTRRRADQAVEGRPGAARVDESPLGSMIPVRA